MVAVAVAADNNRIAVATIATDAGTWGNDGGGGGVADEPDIVYQGTTSQSRKVGTSRIGRSYDDSAGAGSVDATATGRRHFGFKVLATNYGALLSRSSPAMGIKIGSSSTAHQEYYVYGNDNYPAAGGFQFIWISPNVTGYVDVDNTPTLTAIDYYSLLADFSGASVAVNMVIDAIEQGQGLKLTGGDGVSTDGVFADFLAADEGTTSNRWGFVRSLNGIYFCNGELAIGENTSETAVATVFQDATGQVFVWENGLVETGFHAFKLNLGNATTDIDITGATFDCVGKDANDGDRGHTTTEDSRLTVTVTGTSGDAKFVGCVFKNLSTMDLTSATTLDTCDVEVETMTMSGAEIFDSIIRTTSATSVATLTDPTFGTSTDLRDTEFIQQGAGHALELSAIGATVTLTNITFTGYGADTTDDAAIDVTAASGTTTINWSGGTAPTYKTAGATVNVVNSVSVTVTVKDAGTSANIENARVFIEADTGGALPVADVVTITRVTTTASVAHTAHGLANGDKVAIRDALQAEYNGVKTISNVTTNAYDFTVTGTPTTPATGTITSTAVVLEGLTNASGVATNTGFAFGSDQPITGRVRKGTTTPKYQTSPVSGDITADGFATTVFLVSDE